MKFKLGSILALLLTASLGTRGQLQAPISIAVTKVAGPRRTLANNISDLFTANLSADPRFALVDRLQLDKIMAEQALGRSGNVDPETAAKIGKLTGAKVLVTGREFNASDGQVVVIATVIGTETGRVFSHTAQGATANLVAVISELSQKVAETIAVQSTNLIRTATDGRERRIESLAAKLKGRKLPIVSVRIEEQIAGERGSSQIVGTELGLILQKTGFSVVDEKSSLRADILVSGDAIAAKSEKNSDHFSSRATLQIKAQERATGKILVLDLQQSTAVDSGEQMVASKALQNAAVELAERLLPLLAPDETNK